MPLFQLHIPASMRRSNRSTVTVYGYEPVAPEHQAILSTYYLDTAATNRMRQQKSVTEVDVMVAGLMVLTTASTLMFVTHSLRTTFISSVVVCGALLLWGVLRDRRFKRSQAVIQTLNDYERKKLFAITAEPGDILLPYHESEPAESYLALMPVPLLFRTVRQVFWINDVLGVSLEYLLGAECKKNQPTLYAAVEKVVSTYVFKTTVQFDTLLLSKRTDFNVTNVRRTVETLIASAQMLIEVKVEEYARASLSKEAFDRRKERLAAVQRVDRGR